MVNRNASGSAFGWDFQSNAAIVLMLKNIREATAIKVEGQMEDIEVYLENGNIIYSQAKSVFKTEDFSNVKTKLKDGLKTLNDDAKTGNNRELIYITNSPNPFNDVETMYCFYGFAQLGFKDLPESCQNEIKNMIEKYSYNALQLDKLKIYVLPFNGDGENRYRVVKERVYEFLHEININNSGLGQSILEIWQRMFNINESQHDFKINITKEQLIWPVIVSKCEVSKDDEFFTQYDDGDFDEIESKYRDVINNNAEKFEVFTRIVSDYSQYDDPKPREKVKNFIQLYWRQFSDEFDVPQISLEIKEAVVKLIIHKILQKRHIISNIKKEVNL